MSNKQNPTTTTTTKAAQPGQKERVAKKEERVAKKEERVVKKEERVVEVSAGGSGWVPAEVYVGGKMGRTVLEQRLLARFQSRSWAVRLTVNHMPVNHPHRQTQRTVSYWYDWKETTPDAVARFMDAVERAAAKSWKGPTWLFIRWVTTPSPALEGWLTELLDAGPALVWPDGSSPRLSPGNFIADLFFEPTSPSAWELVARLVGDGGGR